MKLSAARSDWLNLPRVMILLQENMPLVQRGQKPKTFQRCIFHRLTDFALSFDLQINGGRSKDFKIETA